MNTRKQLTRTRRAVAFAAAILAGMGVAGCRSASSPELAGPEYPDEVVQAKTLDIQVVRTETVIRLTNTTARSFGKSTLWMNRWYSHPIEKFGVGETLELSLWDFRDENGEAFRAGGFFATRRPDRLVQAQLETDGSMHGLVVVKGEE